MAPDTCGVRVERGDAAGGRGVGHLSVTAGARDAGAAVVSHDGLQYLLMAHPDAVDGNDPLSQTLMTTLTSGRVEWAGLTT